jgi:hypothetical protein
MPTPAAKSHRALWILGGALAVIVVFIAALILAPRFSKTAAMSKNETSSHPPAEAAMPAAAPARQAAGPTAPAASQGQSASTVTAVPPNAQAQDRAASSPARTLTKTAPKRSAPPVEASAPQNVPAGAPVQEAVQPSGQAEPAGPSDEEIAQAQDELVKLNSRASAVAGTVERLQQQQAADGLGLRQDMAGAYSRMNGYLQAASNDLGQRNLTAANRHMTLAEKEVSTLESFFNK